MANKKQVAQDLVSISEAARLRGVTPQSIDELITRGRLPAVEIAGRRLLNRSDVLNFQKEKPGRKAENGTKKGGKK